jgi:uncharacterized phiE125 gp8 family phage protein
MTTRIITPPTVEPVTLAEAKLHLKEDLVSVDNDARISVLISAARQAVEHAMGRAIMLQTLETTLDEFPSAIRLDAPPIIDVVSVEYTATDGASTLLSGASYTLDNASEPGWLVPAYGYAWPATQISINAVRVRYRAGYSASTDAATAQAAVPAGIKYAILLELGSRYKYGATDDAAPAMRHDFARHLLDPFKIYTL